MFGERHGTGKYVYANGDVYQGAYEMGKRMNSGTLTDHTGLQLYDEKTLKGNQQQQQQQQLVHMGNSNPTLGSTHRVHIKPEGGRIKGKSALQQQRQYVDREESSERVFKSIKTHHIQQHSPLPPSFDDLTPAHVMNRSRCDGGGTVVGNDLEGVKLKAGSSRSGRKITSVDNHPKADRFVTSSEARAVAASVREREDEARWQHQRSDAMNEAKAKELAKEAKRVQRLETPYEPGGPTAVGKDTEGYTDQIQTSISRTGRVTTSVSLSKKSI